MRRLSGLRSSNGGQSLAGQRADVQDLTDRPYRRATQVKAGGWREEVTKGHFFPYLLWVPALVPLLVMVVYPTIYLVTTSLYRSNPMNPGASEFVGLDNFVRAFTNAELINALGRTAVFAVTSLGLEFFLGIGLALTVWKYIRRGHVVLKTLLIAPMMMTPVAVGLVWRWLYDPEMGLINYMLGLIGLPAHTWLGDTATALPAVIVVEVWQWTPFVFLGTLAALSAISREPLEAAQVDGANPWQTLVHVILPLISSVLFVVFVFRVIDLFKAFDIVYVLTEGGPGTATDILPFHIYKQAFRYFNVGYAAAVSWLLVVFITLIYSWLLKRMNYVHA